MEKSRILSYFRNTYYENLVNIIYKEGENGKGRDEKKNGRMMKKRKCGGDDGKQKKLQKKRRK